LGLAIEGKKAAAKIGFTAALTGSWHACKAHLLFTQCQYISSIDFPGKSAIDANSSRPMITRPNTLFPWALYF
jgi:hypothetical protein